MSDKKESPCVRCGTCKAHCPSIRLDPVEPFSPRAWMMLIDEYKYNKIEISKRMVELIYSCLLCDACKDRCPSGVDIKENILWMRRKLKDHLYGRTLKAMRILELFYMSGRMGDILIRYTGPLKRVFMELLLDKKIKIPEAGIKEGIYEGKKKKKERIFFFTGCLVRYIMPHLGESLIRFLIRSGFDVIVFNKERCCGAPYESMGLYMEKERLIQFNKDMFSKYNPSRIITLCPTCAGVLREEGIDILTLNEFIALNQERLIFSNNRDSDFVIHEPCHLRYTLKVDAILYGEILKDRGYNVRYMEGGCCGFAGVFTFINKEQSRNISERLRNNYIKSGIKSIVTSCPMCMLSIKDNGMDVKHIVEVL